jgi:hypothetical protein
MLVFLIIIFCKNRRSNLYFGDRVAVLNDFLHQTGGGNLLITISTIRDCRAGLIPHLLTRID